MTPLTPRDYDPDDPYYRDVRLTPMGGEKYTPYGYDVRRFSCEELELFNPNGPVNPPNPKSRQRRRQQSQQRPQSQQRQQWQLGPVSCWAIFSLPGLFFIVTGSMGWIATVFFAMIATFVGSLWASCCPSQNFVVKNGLMCCGFCTLITAGIGLFILPQYLIAIAIAIAAHAAYQTTRDEET
jgi:hypothetical protein